MKKYIVLFVAFSIFCSNQVIGQSPAVSWPANYAVFQRNTITGGGSADVVFSGQIFGGFNTSQYRIERLNKDGSFNSDYSGWQSLPFGSNSGMGSSNSSLFNFTLPTIPTGWYRFSVKNNTGLTSSVKFGVGEVLVIAGQSNAQGFGGTNNVSPLDALGQPTLKNYDCVVSFKVTNPNYNALPRPVFGVLNNSDPNIGPVGFRPWFYQYLGEKIIDSEGSAMVIPVCFFNTAIAGTSIDNWVTSLNKAKSMFSNNYANSLVAGSTVPFQIPWGNTFSDNRGLYMNLKNVLSYYCNMLGVRGVLWHQGEAETKQLLTQQTGSFYSEIGPVDVNFDITTYATKLNSLITDSRTIIPNLTWAICRVSTFSAYVSPNNTPLHKISNSNSTLYADVNSYPVAGDVIAQQNSLVSSANKIVFASTNSDNNTGRQSDGTHFNEAGLLAIGNEIFGNIGNILSNTPFLPRSPMKLNYLGRSGNNYNFSVTNSNTVKYVFPFIPTSTVNQIVQATAMVSSNSNSSNGLLQTGYGKDPSGRIFLTTVAQLGGISNLRIANTQNLLNSNIYPNPVSANETVTVSFELTDPATTKVEVLDEKMNILTLIEEKELEKGKHTYDLKVVGNNNTEAQVLYCRLVVNGDAVVRRIILNN